VIRKLLGDITVPFVEAAVERMFNADEVTGVVDLARPSPKRDNGFSSLNR
jgi:hypothetical protein